MGKNEATYEKRTKRVPLPPGWDIREFVMRELDGTDDLEIGSWAERKMTSAQDTLSAQLRVERREAVRCALVSVDGEPVNVDGVPYAGMDRWSHRLMVVVNTTFNELNALEPSQLKKILAGEYESTGAAQSLRSVGEHSAG